MFAVVGIKKILDIIKWKSIVIVGVVDFSIFNFDIGTYEQINIQIVEKNSSMCLYLFQGVSVFFHWFLEYFRDFWSLITASKISLIVLLLTSLILCTLSFNSNRSLLFQLALLTIPKKQVGIRDNNSFKSISNNQETTLPLEII